MSEPPVPTPPPPDAAPSSRAGRRWWILGGLALGLVALLALTPLGQIALVVALNQVETTEFEVRGNELHMRGEINSKTLDQFIAVMEENPEITVLVERTVPGSLDDDTMIELGYEVRRRGLHTRLLADSAIDSGGVDLFLAGVERTMVDGAHIGVHSWSDGTREATDFPRDSEEHEQNRAYVESMLGSDAFYWFTIEAAPADGIHPMSAEEIERFGLLTAPIEPGD